MTFDPNIPQANDIISVSQGEILTNFSQLNTIFDVDHVTFNDVTAANRGKHDKATFVNQAADPVTAANEMAVYAKDVAGTPSLFIRQQSNGTISRFDGVASNPGRVFLPDGIVMAFGSQAGATNGTVINFGYTFNTVLSIQLTAVRPNPSRVFLHENSSTTSSVTIRFVDQNNNPGPASTIRWLAIGIA